MTQAGVGTAHLSAVSDSNADNDVYVIHGVALGSDDVTVGHLSRQKKKWPDEELKKSAKTLEGKDLVKDHNNGTDGKVGTVTKAKYKDGVGVVYEAEIAGHYEELAEDIKAGLLEVSPRAYHRDTEELEVDDETGAYIVEDILFDNLSIVTTGASPSNTLNYGEAEDLSGSLTIETVNQGSSRMSKAELEETFEGEGGSNGSDVGVNVDEVYSEWKNAVNMTATDLREWYNNPCYKEASIKPKKVVERNLHLLETPKRQWGEDEVEDAKRTISFINRMSSDEMKPDDPKDGPNGCPSKWAISLINWAYNPFDELPKKHEREEEEMNDFNKIMTNDVSELAQIDGLEIFGMVMWGNGKHGTISDFITENGKLKAEIDVVEREDGRYQKTGETVTKSIYSVDTMSKEEMADGSVHRVDFDDTTRSDWSEPTLNDFTEMMWDELNESRKSEISDHYLYTVGEFPPENFSDLRLPVVDSEGNLNLNALQNAKARVGQISGISDSQVDEIKTIINDLAESNFEGVDYSSEEEMSESSNKTVVIAELSDDDPEKASTSGFNAYIVDN